MVVQNTIVLTWTLDVLPFLDSVLHIGYIPKKVGHPGSRYYGDPQKGTHNFGKSPCMPADTCSSLHRPFKHFPTPQYSRFPIAAQVYSITGFDIWESGTVEIKATRGNFEILTLARSQFSGSYFCYLGGKSLHVVFFREELRRSQERASKLSQALNLNPSTVKPKPVLFHGGCRIM